MLCQLLKYQHLDADDYYWAKTDIPFQIKIPIEERNAKLKKDFEAAKSVLLSGSMVTWGIEWERAFDLVVFLFVPAEIRMKRLEQREKERYGDLLKTDKLRIANSKAFLAWAKKYDDPNFDGRGIAQHTNWMKVLTCPVLQIVGDTTIETCVKLVLEKINQLNNLSCEQ